MVEMKLALSDHNPIVYIRQGLLISLAIPSALLIVLFTKLLSVMKGF